jgi:zinc D-Ala-D-Ala dipeptidase
VVSVGAADDPLEPMRLIPIAPPEYDVDVALVYATSGNFTGRPIYRAGAGAYLAEPAAAALARAIALAKGLGLRLRLTDAFRPSEAQWALWAHTPDPTFLADPLKGSPHSRGVAVDVTLIDARGGEIDMGTAVDALTPLSFHATVAGLTADQQRNRFVLLGLMTAAGWDHYRNEWWHYQLFDARSYPLRSEAELPAPMLTDAARDAARA